MQKANQLLIKRKLINYSQHQENNFHKKYKKRKVLNNINNNNPNNKRNKKHGGRKSMKRKKIINRNNNKLLKLDKVKIKRKNGSVLTYLENDILIIKQYIQENI